jgi:hypothetical protein
MMVKLTPGVDFTNIYVKSSICAEKYNTIFGAEPLMPLPLPKHIDENDPSSLRKEWPRLPKKRIKNGVNVIY